MMSRSTKRQKQKIKLTKKKRKAQIKRKIQREITYALQMNKIKHYNLTERTDYSNKIS